MSTQGPPSNSQEEEQMKIRGFVELAIEKSSPARYEVVIQVPDEFTDHEIEMNLTRALNEASPTLDRKRMRVVGWKECEWQTPLCAKPAIKERAA